MEILQDSSTFFMFDFDQSSTVVKEVRTFLSEDSTFSDSEKSVFLSKLLAAGYHSLEVIGFILTLWNIYDRDETA